MTQNHNGLREYPLKIGSIPSKNATLLHISNFSASEGQQQGKIDWVEHKVTSY